jgi:16S rRNA (cytosine967-C5)-methyltransferase
MRSHSYLNTTKKIIQSYDGNIPLTSWLKQFFKADKKFGSRDRKEISHACYCFYRSGNGFKNLNEEEQILVALFLCSNSSTKILEELKSEWSEKLSLPLNEKINLLSVVDEIKNIFPLTNELSKEIDGQEFNLSFLIQPDLYLRIRPGRKEKVLQQLDISRIDFALLNDNCIQLNNQSKVDEVLCIDEDVVIQDLNSQKTIEPFVNYKPQTANPKLSAWDCCAASGGKSILFHDHFPDSQLTVSDIRESILINLKKRFQKAGIRSSQSFVADISSERFSINKRFDLIICDAPCSGSGTWSRTPEQLHFFKKEKIDHYASLQKKIVSNASKALKKNGFLLYITCSVFKKENEEVVRFIQNKLSLQLKSMQYLKGYDKKADTLFVALFSAHSLISFFVAINLLPS